MRSSSSPSDFGIPLPELPVQTGKRFDEAFRPLSKRLVCCLPPRLPGQEVFAELRVLESVTATH